MGLRDSHSIDLLLERPPFETEPCKLLLLIIDATSDLSDADRYDLLLKKLAAYVTYVRHPSFAQSHPKLTPADVIVRVLTVMPPTIQMLQIDAVKSPDLTIRLRVFFDDYHAFMAKVKSGRDRPLSSN